MHPFCARTVLKLSKAERSITRVLNRFVLEIREASVAMKTFNGT